jgi:hypothetical protein
VTKVVTLAAAAVLFVIVATANSGGYRYGASDQAFYQPAIALAADPDLFPRDRVVLAAQMRHWPGAYVIGAAGRLTDGDWPRLFIAFYITTLVALFAAGVLFARAIGASWWVVSVFLALLTLRHRIAKTGANSLEGYMHPRMLAFALGLAACAAMVRTRWTVAAALIIVAAVLHPTTAVWFGGAWMVAFATANGYGRAMTATMIAVSVVCLAALLFSPLAGHVEHMDAAWLAVLGEKDYLFSADWPAYAWITNLAYPALLVLIYRRRARAGVTAPGEYALVVGMLALVAVFLVSVPLASARVALAVQAQVNRVFWVLDAMVALYVAWWILDTASRPGARTTWRTVTAGAVVALAVGRGVYVNGFETRRPLFEVRLPSTSWVEAMTWLRAQPATWHVLADPAHAWKYGASVRVAAVKDVLLEASKDAALSMYDHDVATRTAERQRALDHFDQMTVADIHTLAATFDLDVFVDATTRRFDLPVLYRNDEFVVYSLR